MSLRLKVSLKIFVSFGVLAFLLTQVDVYLIRIRLQNLSLSFVALALIYYTICQVMSCVRWQIILWSSGHMARFSILISSYFSGMFLNTFLPSSIGGDVYRVYRVGKYCQNQAVGFTSVFLERATGLLSLLAIAFMSLPPAFHIIGRWNIILLLAACTIIMGGGTLLLVSPKILIWVESLLGHFRLAQLTSRISKSQILMIKFIQHKRALIYSVSLSLLLQICLVYYYFLIAQQLSIRIAYLELLVFIPIITIVSLLPISLGGLGIREGILAYLFNQIGLSSEDALTFSITVTALGLLLSLPGGVVLLFDLTGFKQASKDSGKTN